MKSVEAVFEAPPGHWVGDGFPVRSLFSYQDQGRQVSPFLLLDYAAPTSFAPGTQRRGVGEHPHRGFETVTIVYSGEVSHRDSSGGGGTIRPGDVQWMTAGSGLVHDEFHSQEFTRAGGEMEMVQLWVNLPAAHKMSPPRYQNLTRDSIPSIALGERSALRVIAGAYRGHRGPARTFTPVNVWDAHFAAGLRVELPAAEGHRLIVVLLDGALSVNDDRSLSGVAAAILHPDGQNAVLEATADARLLILSGEPIDEPLVGYGPFVMNTPQQIRDAIADFASGKFGSLPTSASAG